MCRSAARWRAARLPWQPPCSLRRLCSPAARGARRAERRAAPRVAPQMVEPHDEGAEIGGAPPLPPETIRLPERGFTINRRKALIAAAICWVGFAVMVWLVASG